MYSLIITLLIFGDIIYGLSIDDALQIAGCLVHCHQNEPCENSCYQNFSSTTALTRLPMNANFNATLHCRDIDLLTLAHTPGIFVTEQSESNSTWGEVTVHNGRMSTFSNLLPDTRYRYRVQQVNTDGIFLPETTEWFTTIKSDHCPEPIKAIAVKNIFRKNLNSSHLKAEIIFEPARDRSCLYDIVVWADGNGLTSGHVNATNNFRFTLPGLEYDSNNTVIISARHRGISQHSNNVSLSFNIPSCLDFHKNLTICAPKKVEGLRVVYEHKSGTRGRLRFTWNRPDFPPDKYTIQILTPDPMKQPQLISVPGDVIEVSHAITDDSYDHYMIGIVAESPGGSSPPTTIAITPDDHRINSSAPAAPHEDTVIITFSIVIVIVAAVFTFTYLKRRKKSKHKHQIKFRKNLKENANLCPSFEKPLKTTCDTEKKTENNLLMHKDDFEISPINLAIKDILGSGITGVVRLGVLRVNENKSLNVAVKMLRECPSTDEIRCLQQEIMIMKSAGTHPNIVSMIGCCTLNIEPMLVVEYCKKGDLQNYLRLIWKNILIYADTKARGKFVDETTNEDINRPLITHCPYIMGNREAVSNQLYDIEQDMLNKADEITAEDLLSFALQIANGMEYLSLNRIVHRDLAARNVLVCDDHVVKISDFGLSRDVYRENVYKKRGNEKLPLKWMAIEALTHQIYTTQSDVWSFGILLWEIVTLGSNPYPDIPTNMILQHLKSGNRMGKPSNCGKELYDIMTSCWRSSPRSRPTFTELKNSLDNLLLTVSNHEYVNFCDIINERRDTTKD